MAGIPRDRTPPHDDEAERAALGAMLFDTEAVAAAMQYIRPEDFYSNANGKIYAAILGLQDRGVKPDTLTVVGELRQQGKLDEAGGADYVSSLTGVVPTSANIEYYAQTVQAYSLRRALLTVSSEIAVRAFDESVEANQILEDVQQRIFDLSDRRQIFRFRTAHEVVAEAARIIDTLHANKQEYTGITTGFSELDFLTGGFNPSEFVIIGARPSIGKTALALNMAIHAAMKKKVPTAFFTLEMSDISLMMRILSSESSVDSKSIRSGNLKTSELANIYNTMEKLYDAQLYMVDQSNMRLLDLRSQARRLRANQKVGIIFIDYITLITLDDSRLKPYEQISEISRSLKSLARELDIPIVVLSQLTREAEKDRPNLANIRASGAIEQDADLVIFLNRKREADKKNGVEVNSSDPIEAELILAKNRNGPTGKVNLLFLPKFAKFTSITKGNSL
jgi:replicative DNA helicase